jgi:hypothetical protein
MFTHSKEKSKQTTKGAVQKQEARSAVAPPNLTGIPDVMKTRFENLSSLSFDDVRVHYNSDKPAQLQALAYTQGNQVYVAPGQEKHLGHELGHVVQQKQGRVRPTETINGVQVNTNRTLEEEAETIGGGIVQKCAAPAGFAESRGVVQRAIILVKESEEPKKPEESEVTKGPEATKKRWTAPKPKEPKKPKKQKNAKYEEPKKPEEPKKSEIKIENMEDLTRCCPQIISNLTKKFNEDKRFKTVKWNIVEKSVANAFGDNDIRIIIPDKNFDSKDYESSILGTLKSLLSERIASITHRTAESEAASLKDTKTITRETIILGCEVADHGFKDGSYSSKGGYIYEALKEEWLLPKEIQLGHEGGPGAKDFAFFLNGLAFVFAKGSHTETKVSCPQKKHMPYKIDCNVLPVSQEINYIALADAKMYYGKATEMTSVF